MPDPNDRAADLLAKFDGSVRPVAYLPCDGYDTARAFPSTRAMQSMAERSKAAASIAPRAMSGGACLRTPHLWEALL